MNICLIFQAILSKHSLSSYQILRGMQAWSDVMPPSLRHEGRALTTNDCIGGCRCLPFPLHHHSTTSPKHQIHQTNRRNGQTQVDVRQGQARQCFFLQPHHPIHHKACRRRAVWRQRRQCRGRCLTHQPWRHHHRSLQGSDPEGKPPCREHWLPAHTNLQLDLQELRHSSSYRQIRQRHLPPHHSGLHDPGRWPHWNWYRWLFHLRRQVRGRVRVVPQARRQGYAQHGQLRSWHQRKPVLHHSRPDSSPQRQAHCVWQGCAGHGCRRQARQRRDWQSR